MGPTVPGYHLRGCLARSGTTSVHRAEAIGRPGRVLVVEHLRVRPDSASLARLRHTAEVLHGLAHPNVLPLLDVVDTGSGIALVTPFAPGGSLAEAIDRAPAGLPPAMIAAVGNRIADGLAALHEHGVVHGAVTARSVRFDAQGRPLLADTGTVLLHDGAGSIPTPDSVDGPRSAVRGAATDLRALGSVLAAALTGTGAGHGGPPADQPAAPRQEVPGALVTAIERALATGDDHRDLDARELAAALARAEEVAVEAAAHGIAAPTHPNAAPTHPTAAPTHPTAALPDRTAMLLDRTAVLPDRTAMLPDGIATTGRRVSRWARPTLATAAGLLLLALLVPLVTALDLTALAVTARDLTPRDDPSADAVPPAPIPPEPSGVPDPPDPAAATRPEPGSPAAATRPEPGPRDAAGPGPRHQPLICTGLEAPPGDGAVLLADLDGRGCSTPVRWDGRELTVATAGSGPRRYELLADDDDQLLFGDLSCGDRDAPILYRPGTGEVFVFDGLVAPGEEVTVTGEPSGRVGGRARIVTDDAGCDRIRVDQGR